MYNNLWEEMKQEQNAKERNEALSALAKALGYYKCSLCRAGFTETEALELCRTLQNKLMGGSQ